jgi:hypothetical protein
VSPRTTAFTAPTLTSLCLDGVGRENATAFGMAIDAMGWRRDGLTVRRRRVSFLDIAAPLDAIIGVRYRGSLSRGLLDHFGLKWSGPLFDRMIHTLSAFRPG